MGYNFISFQWFLVILLDYEITCSKGKNGRFLIVFKELSNYCSYPQQASKTQTFILLESKTDANSCSGNKVFECTVCKGMKGM